MLYIVPMKVAYAAIPKVLVSLPAQSATFFVAAVFALVATPHPS